jgi:hypothetical protein
MKRITLATLLIFLCAAVSGAQEKPDDYKKVLQVLGRFGDYRAGVLKVSVPRGDVQISVAGKKVPWTFGFGGWVAFTKGDAEMDVMMGDLVLTEDEVNPVMSVLLENGIEVTALHNHFFWEQPRVFYMHVHAHGKAEELARKVKPALDMIPAATTLRTEISQLDGKKISGIVGYPGDTMGGVWKITFGRDDIGLKELGATINEQMGLNTWAAFFGTMEDAVVAGDIAMLASEVTPVLKALRANGLEVVAIHHHMIGTQPMVIFLHYWGRGPAEKLAAAFRAAIEKTNAAPKK